MFKEIKQIRLLLFAAVVWMFAGFNVMRLGILSFYKPIYWWEPVLMVMVFLVFAVFIFGPLVKKNVVRIAAYQTPQPFYRFFDRKGFTMMALMITLGVSLRASHLLPDVAIAVFYTGLGGALAMAGILFMKAYIEAHRKVQG